MIWKVAMWGGPRDYELIKKLMSSSYQTLQVVCDEKNWVHGEGIIVGTEENRIRDASWLIGKSFFDDAKNLPRFIIDEHNLPSFKFNKVQWPRSKNKISCKN